MGADYDLIRKVFRPNRFRNRFQTNRVLRVSKAPPYSPPSPHFALPLWEAYVALYFVCSFVQVPLSRGFIGEGAHPKLPPGDLPYFTGPWSTVSPGFFECNVYQLTGLRLPQSGPRLFEGRAAQLLIRGPPPFPFPLRDLQT